MRDWATLHPEWAPIVNRIAASTGGRVHHLRGDLYQVGWLALLERDDVDPTSQHGLMVRVIHNAMKDYVVLWLSGNVGRNPKSRGGHVITTPGDAAILSTENTRRVVEDAADARPTQIRAMVSPRALTILDKKGRGEWVSNAESQNLSKARRNLAAKLAATHPPTACADCVDGHPEYMGEDGVWRCYQHRTRPVVLFNHPRERNLWDGEQHDIAAPTWRRYPRLTDRPEPSPEYAEWLAHFRSRPVEERDDAIQAWTRRWRSTLA